MLCSICPGAEATFASGGSINFGSNKRGCEMLAGTMFLMGNDDPLVPLRKAVQPLGELMGQPHAAMRGGVAWQSALVHGDAGPGEALHVGHGRVVIEVGTVDALFADDAEDAVRCWVIGHAGRDWRDFVKAAFVIYGDALLVRRDHEKQGAVGAASSPAWSLPWSSPLWWWCERAKAALPAPTPANATHATSANRRQGWATRQPVIPLRTSNAPSIAQRDTISLPRLRRPPKVVRLATRRSSPFKQATAFSLSQTGPLLTLQRAVCRLSRPESRPFLSDSKRRIVGVSLSPGGVKRRHVRLVQGSGCTQARHQIGIGKKRPSERDEVPSFFKERDRRCGAIEAAGNDEQAVEAGAKPGLEIGRHRWSAHRGMIDKMKV